VTDEEPDQRIRLLVLLQVAIVEDEFTAPSSGTGKRAAEGPCETVGSLNLAADGAPLVRFDVFAAVASGGIEVDTDQFVVQHIAAHDMIEQLP
jgi:hypothetical protein